MANPDPLRGSGLRHLHPIFEKLKYEISLVDETNKNKSNRAHQIDPKIYIKKFFTVLKIKIRILSLLK